MKKVVLVLMLIFVFLSNMVYADERGSYKKIPIEQVSVEAVEVTVLKEIEIDENAINLDGFNLIEPKGTSVLTR